MNQETRSDAEFLRKKDEQHVKSFKYRDYACIIEAQEINAVNRYITSLESKWIDVKDLEKSDLKDGDSVIVFVPSHPTLKTWPAKYFAEFEHFAAGSEPPCVGWFEREEITHFMITPLPTLQMLEETKDIPISET